MFPRLLDYLGLLREGAFRRLWLAQTISQFGTQVTQLALPLVAILVLEASPFEVALLGAIEFLPFLLFTLPAGAWVDRLPKRRLMVAADLGRMLALGVVPVAALAGRLALWELYVVGFVAGVLTVFFDISYQAVIPELVSRERLQEGNSRLEISRSAASVLGPGVSGVLVGALTAPIAILVDAVSYLASALFLVGMRPRFSPPPRPTQASRSSLRSEIAEGLRFYRRSPLLLSSSAAIVILNFGGQIGGAILLVYLVRDLALTPAALGLAFSLGSLGILAGATTGSAFGKRVGVGPTIVVASALGGIAALILVAASPTTAFWLLIVSGLLQGYGFMLININGVSLRQALTPDHLQGRVNATGRWINWSVIPPGTILGGVIASVLPLRTTVAIGAVVALVAVPVLLASPLRRLRELPRQPSAHGGEPSPIEPPEVIIPT